LKGGWLAGAWFWRRACVRTARPYAGGRALLSHHISCLHLSPLGHWGMREDAATTFCASCALSRSTPAHTVLTARHLLLCLALALPDCCGIFCCCRSGSLQAAAAAWQALASALPFGDTVAPPLRRRWTFRRRAAGGRNCAVTAWVARRADSATCAARCLLAADAISVGRLNWSALRGSVETSAHALLSAFLRAVGRLLLPNCAALDAAYVAEAAWRLRMFSVALFRRVW